jgi:hypothetical protein
MGSHRTSQSSGGLPLGHTNLPQQPQYSGISTRDGSSDSGFGSPTGFAPDRSGCGCIFAPVTWTRSWPTQNRVSVRDSFSPAGAPETPKNWNTKETRDKTRNPKKTPKPGKKTQKNLKPESNPKTPKRNPFIKPDEHPNLTQNPTGSGLDAKFYPRVRVRVSNSTWLHFFTGRVFCRPDPNLTRCHS